MRALRVAQLGGVLAQPLTHRVECVRQLVELVAFGAGAPQPQRRRMGVRRHLRDRSGDVQDVARRQVVHDEQDEERDQEGLGGVAEQDDQRLRRQVAIDVGERGLDVQHTDLFGWSAQHSSGISRTTRSVVWRSPRKTENARPGTPSSRTSAARIEGRRTMPSSCSSSWRLSSAHSLFSEAARAGLLDLGEAASRRARSLR